MFFSILKIQTCSAVLLRSLQFWLLRSIVVIVIVYLLIVLLLVVVIWNQDHPDLFPKRNKVFESAEESQHGWNSNCSFNSTHNSATYNHLSEQQVSAATRIVCQEPHIYQKNVRNTRGLLEWMTRDKNGLSLTIEACVRVSESSQRKSRLHAAKHMRVNVGLR